MSKQSGGCHSEFSLRRKPSYQKTITMGEGSVLMALILQTFQKLFLSLFCLIPSPCEDRPMQINGGNLGVNQCCVLEFWSLTLFADYQRFLDYVFGHTRFLYNVKQ